MNLLPPSSFPNSFDCFSHINNPSSFPFLKKTLDLFVLFKIQIDQVEMEDWKTKSNKMTMELNELKAQYKELENRVIEIRKSIRTKRLKPAQKILKA